MQVVQHVAAVVGGVAQVAPIKNYLRVCEKLVLDYELDITKVVDLVRGKILCESVEQMSQAIVALTRLDPSMSTIYSELPELHDKRVPLEPPTRPSSPRTRIAEVAGAELEVHVGKEELKLAVPADIEIVCAKNRLGTFVIHKKFHLQLIIELFIRILFVDCFELTFFLYSSDRLIVFEIIFSLISAH